MKITAIDKVNEALKNFGASDKVRQQGADFGGRQFSSYKKCTRPFSYSRNYQNLLRRLIHNSRPDTLSTCSTLSTLSEKEIASRSRRDKVIKARALLIGAWRETGDRLVDLQPILKRDLSMLSRLSKISESVDNRKVMKQVLMALNAHMQA